MKIRQPIYFSPDLMHRIYYDKETKKYMLNYTTTNTDLCAIPLVKKSIMHQLKRKNYDLLN